MRSTDKPVAASICGVLSGLVIITTSFFLYIYFPRKYLLLEELFLLLANPRGATVNPVEFMVWVATITGIVNILSGIFIYTFPARKNLLAFLILISTVVSVYSLGGLAIGMILGTYAFYLALRWKPKKT